MKAFWFWLFPVFGAICLLLSIWAWIGVITESFSWTTTFPAVINGLFILPGVALSVGVDVFLLARRNPREVRLAERIVLVALVALVGGTIWLGFSEEAGWAGLFTWPAIILVAIALTVLIAVGNSRTKAAALPPSPFDQAPAVQPPTAAPPTAAG